ncbi:MAG: hypothetical protein HYZ53_06445 [Planctomycetes bacterium]|nr:hypothetical protein [Planctomycetota bacterium]
MNWSRFGRRSGAAVAFALALLVGAGAAQGQEWGEESTTPEMQAKRKEIANKLATFKLSMDFNDAQLDDVIDFCREVSKINFIIDRRVWDKARPDELRITLKLNDVPLRVALKLVLEPRNLATVFRDGVLVIVPKDVLEEELHLQIYDVRDLMFKIHDFPGPGLELTAGGGSGQQGAIFTAEPEPTVLNDPQQLMDLIKKNVGGDTWDRVPGTSISISNGVLMVVQSRKVQREVAELVINLRAFK